MSHPSSILLSNGTVLLHDDEDHVNPVRVDILIINNKIAEIAPSISPPSPSPDAIDIDCTGKIISPGFVDTHHHVWQTQLKGRHADDLLLDYMYKGNIVFSLFKPEDVFWGELGGCMEAIDGGTTTVVDHAHINYSSDHSSSALSATVASGIRSYFCYCPVPQAWPKSWAPFEFERPPMDVPDWAANQLADLAAKQPFGNGRVRLGVGFDSYYLPQKIVVSLFERARNLGVKLFTSHYVGTFTGPHSIVSLLDKYGLLQDDILLSHATEALPEDAVQLIAEHAHVSSTPDTELQMAHGAPICFRPDFNKIASLGVDCHSNNSSDMLSQMRLALQSARGMRNQQFLGRGKLPRAMSATVEQAFNLGTIKGARAVGMGSEIGSIRVGKLADLVVFDAESPSMVCAGEHNPVAAIVMHASVRDIETVIVDGKIRKFRGKLVPVDVGEGVEVKWSEVAAKLLHSRRRLQEIIEAADMDGAREATIKLFRLNPNNIVDHL